MARPNVVPSQLLSDGALADEASNLNQPSPQLLAKLRSGRETGRLSEDDIVQQHIGRRGLPGEPPTAKALPENVTQILKPLDPGHTA
jgi:hypothetical protein